MNSDIRKTYIAGFIVILIVLSCFVLLPAQINNPPSSSPSSGTSPFTVASAANAGVIDIGSDGAVNISRNSNNNMTLNATGGAGVQISAASGLSIASGNLAFSAGLGQHINTQAANNDIGGVLTCATSTVTKTFSTAYASTPTIIVSDETTAGGARVSAKSNTAFTVTCTGATDTLDYQVTGNPN